MVLHAYFFSKTMLNTTAAFIVGAGKRLVYLGARVKKNAVGYQRPRIIGMEDGMPMVVDQVISQAYPETQPAFSAGFQVKQTTHCLYKAIKRPKH